MAICDSIIVICVSEGPKWGRARRCQKRPSKSAFFETTSFGLIYSLSRNVRDQKTHFLKKWGSDAGMQILTKFRPPSFEKTLDFGGSQNSDFACFRLFFTLTQKTHFCTHTKCIFYTVKQCVTHKQLTFDTTSSFPI